MLSQALHEPYVKIIIHAGGNDLDLPYKSSGEGGGGGGGEKKFVFTII